LDQSSGTFCRPGTNGQVPVAFAVAQRTSRGAPRSSALELAAPAAGPWPASRLQQCRAPAAAVSRASTTTAAGSTPASAFTTRATSWHSWSPTSSSARTRPRSAARRYGGTCGGAVCWIYTCLTDSWAAWCPWRSGPPGAGFGSCTEADWATGRAESAGCWGGNQRRGL
jgi:hypothetical protein